jgi:hypothetical protein
MYLRERARKLMVAASAPSPDYRSQPGDVHANRFGEIATIARCWPSRAAYPGGAYESGSLRLVKIANAAFNDTNAEWIHFNIEVVLVADI